MHPKRYHARPSAQGVPRLTLVARTGATGGGDRQDACPAPNWRGLWAAVGPVVSLGFLAVMFYFLFLVLAEPPPALEQHPDIPTAGGAP